MNAFQINCDLGEGMDDALLMPYLDACSIACGGHTGDAESMAVTVRLAKQYGVAIGAHPSFPDREGFGRKDLDMPLKELSRSLTCQIAELKEIGDREQASLTHLKAHGALYNKAAAHSDTAKVVVEVAQAFGLPLLAPWQSEMARIADEQHLPVVLEGFADRRYHPDRSLVARSVPGAVIDDPETAVRQVAGIVHEKLLLTLEGIRVPMQATTFCVHGDNPHALAILKRIQQLKKDEY